MVTNEYLQNGTAKTAATNKYSENAGINIWWLGLRALVRRRIFRFHWFISANRGKSEYVHVRSASASNASEPLFYILTNRWKG